MNGIPSEFIGELRRTRGAEDAAALVSALEGEPPVSVRLNPDKDGGIAGGVPVPWSRWGRYLASRPQFTLDTAFHAGAYYVQEAGSQFVEYLLRGADTEGARILDMCAAPGGKTTIYSTLAGEGGLVVANEYVRSRAGVLADNVRRWGVGNVVVTNEDSRRLAGFEGWFDIVAVDAPCSGEGMFRKDPASRDEWNPAAVGACAARQIEILENAWRSLRAGGVLIYSTCTFNTVENEGVLRTFLSRFGEEVGPAEVADVDGLWGIECSEVGPFRTFRFMPHRTVSEGFFAAVAAKSEDAEVRTATPKPRRSVMTDASPAERRELSRWVEGSEGMRFASIGGTLYGYPAARYDDVKMLSQSLAVIYSGVEMGRIYGGVLKPEWALSQYCGLDRSAVACTELPEDEALDYLRKAALPAGDFAEGLNLVLCGGRPLGFLKRIGNRCNNMYPNSLRIMNL